MSDLNVYSNEVTIEIQVTNDTLVVDSRLIAEVLGVDHGDWVRNVIRRYQTEIEADFGLVRFENGLIEGRGRPVVYALLTEDQATCLMTYSKNTDQVRAAKRKLVKSFSQAKQLLRSGETVQPEPKPLPQTTVKEWADVIALLGYQDSPMLKSALQQRMMEELTANQSGGSDSGLTLLTVRANQLGLPPSIVGDGTKLGKFIIRRGVVPEGKQQHGKYQVNVFKVTSDLDNAIRDFHALTMALTILP